MQAVPIAINGSVMSAFKAPSLSPPSAELAQTLGKITTKAVYEISATTSPSGPAALADLEGECSNIGEELASYGATQYYTAVDSQSRASSPSTVMAASPKDSAGNLSPVSVSSSKEEDSSSSSPEPLSPLGGGGEEGCRLAAQQQNMPAAAAMDSHRDHQGGTQVKHWTYEDQFKQLYNLSQEQERKEFLDKLFNFMQNKGTPITRVPIMAKQPLDLYKLFKLVVERGGLVEVIKKKAWRNVAKELNLPASITSAAFTMRSQYVKYLYPYECETAKLSEPQELQTAIDSNKRDRRHSENMEFMAPQLQREVDPHSPAVTTTTHQGLQLISSPTMALPHTSLPPYSGGFIVTGGPGGTQLVQMSPHVPAIPIVVPSPAVSASTVLPFSHSSPSEDKDDVQSHSSRESIEPPPAKRPALEVKAPASVVSCNSSPGGSGNRPYSIQQANTNSFIMTHGNTASPTAHQFIQMTPHGQIPIVLPSASSREQQKCPNTPSTIHVNGRTETQHKSENGGMTVAALPSHPHTNVILTPRGSATVPPPPPSTRNLFQMTPHPNIPGLIIPQQVGAAPSQEEEKKKEVTVTESERVTISNAKIPFANISIQSAGTKSEAGEQNGTDDSLLVTLEINNTVYQGVLFAKPQVLSSPQS